MPPEQLPAFRTDMLTGYATTCLAESRSRVDSLCTPGIVAASRTRRSVSAGLACALIALPGCQRAPSYSILGSFFPVWLFCIILGVVLSFLLHLLLLRLQLNEQLAPPLLVYPSLAILFSLVLWLVFFS